MSRILIIDDDRALVRTLQIQLEEAGHDVRGAADGKAGGEACQVFEPELILLDLRLPDLNGLDILRTLAAAPSGPAIVVITARHEMQLAIEAMRAGAFDYLRKPFELEDVLLLVEKAARFRSLVSRPDSGTSEAQPAGPFEIVGHDRRILEIVKQIGLLSRSPVNLLIEGESGTGKELVARALHQAACPEEPFVAMNCSAIVPSLFESELFGHEKGAFTGAMARKTGKLEHAGSGTLFLDEVGDLPAELQAKLLRVLQEREFERVGGLASVPFRARVVAATHRDLRAMAGDGTFREDLYYRLAVSRLTMPPLRERRADIPALARHLLTKINRLQACPVEGITTGALDLLSEYHWPGNVRELENILTRAAALARGQVITPDDLDFSQAARPAEAVVPPERRGKPATLDEAVRQHIKISLEALDWNITRTARALDISPTTLRKKILDLGIEREP